METNKRTENELNQTAVCVKLRMAKHC